MEQLSTVAEYAAGGLEALGIAVITAIALHSTARAVYLVLRGTATDHIFHGYRLQLFRGILLGLEFLVAADIIHTVAIELTFESVGVLAAVVLIRTFLSFTLEVEMTGRWPWQQRAVDER